MTAARMKAAVDYGWTYCCDDFHGAVERAAAADAAATGGRGGGGGAPAVTALALDLLGSLSRRPAARHRRRPVRRRRRARRASPPSHATPPPPPPPAWSAHPAGLGADGEAGGCCGVQAVSGGCGDVLLLRTLRMLAPSLAVRGVDAVVLPPGSARRVDGVGAPAAEMRLFHPFGSGELLRTRATYSGAPRGGPAGLATEMSPDEREGCGAPHSEATEELVPPPRPPTPPRRPPPADGSPRWIEPRADGGAARRGCERAQRVVDGRWVAAGTDDGELLDACARSRLLGVADCGVARGGCLAVTCVRFADGAAPPAARSWRRAARTARARRGDASARGGGGGGGGGAAADVPRGEGNVRGGREGVPCGWAAEGGDADSARRWELDVNTPTSCTSATARRDAGLAGLAGLRSPPPAPERLARRTWRRRRRQWVPIGAVAASRRTAASPVRRRQPLGVPPPRRWPSPNCTLPPPSAPSATRAAAGCSAPPATAASGSGPTSA